MNARKATPWIVALIVAAGAACVGLRIYARHEIQPFDGDELWRLTYTIHFQAERTGAKLHVAIPNDTPHCRVFRQDLLYSGLTADRLRPSRSETREVSLATLRPGEYGLTARFDLHVSRQARWQSGAAEAEPPAEARAQWLRGTPTVQVTAEPVVEALRQLRREPSRPAELVQRLFDYCANQIALGDDDAPQDAAQAIQQQVATPLGRARALAALCRAAKIPARLVTGLEIREDARLSPHAWVEVLANHHWEPFDPVNGFARELPHNFLPVRRDGLEIVHVRDATGVESVFSLVRLPPGTGLARPGHRRPVDIVDLTRLPLEMHEVLSLILLLPLGALVTAIFRTIIGVRTFGTFTPTLIALSFVFADWRTGIFVFALVIALGLSSRSALDHLKLLLVPRLSVILTLVVLCVIFAVSLLDYLHWTPSAQAVLLPMVILTMTIERFYLTAEEDGTAAAFQLLGGTVLVAFCCYLVLRWSEVGRMLFAFPEVHLLTIAALILIGRYTGYRLTEWWRFRDLAPPGP